MLDIVNTWICAVAVMTPSSDSISIRIALCSRVLFLVEIVLGSEFNIVHHACTHDICRTDKIR